MYALLVLALTAALPQDATQIRLDRNGWIVEATKEDATMAVGESLWWWSAACAPQKLRAGDAVQCGATRELAVRVTDPGRRPVAGAAIVWATAAMLDDLPDRRLPAATTASDGSVRLAVPDEGEIWVRVAGPRLATYWRRIAPGTRNVHLGAAPAVTPRVRVRGEDGPPLHSRIALLPLDCTAICPQRLLLFDDAETPPAAAAVRGASYRLVVWSDSHQPATRTIEITSANDVSMTVSRGAAVAASLVDRDGKPLKHGDLAVQFRLPSLGQGIRRVISAAPDGSVKMAGLPPSPVEWTAVTPGYGRRVGDAALDLGENDLGRIVLTPARRARVVVTDGAQPVPQARVVAHGSATAFTDPKGVADFAELPQDEIAAQIDAEGFLRADSVIPPDRAEITVILQRGATVKATLLRETDGRSPDSVQVRVTNNGVESRRTAAGECVISGLRPGRVRLRIAAEGTQPHDSGEVQVAAGEVADLGVITLKSGSSIRGKVVDESGNPVPAARIRLLQTAGDAPALAHVLGNWQTATSGDDGAFRMGGLSSGSQLVVVDADGLARRILPNVSIETDGQEIDLGNVELSRGKRVDLTCRPVKRCGSEATLLLAGADYPFLALTTLLHDGRGTFHATPPGAMALRLSKATHVLHEETVDIRHGDDAQNIEITLPSVLLRGSVSVGGEAVRDGGSLLFTRSVRSVGLPILMRTTTAQGTSVGSEWIGSFGATLTAAVDDRGSFLIDEIEPGPYEVVFRSGGAVTSPILLLIRDAQEQPVDLRFEDRQIAGSVVDASGHAVPARIDVVDGAGTAHTANSGTDGRFRLLGVSAGRATVTAYASGQRARAEVDPSLGSARDLVLRLSTDDSGLAVTVADENGGPAAGALVFVMSRRGMRIGSTDQDGHAVLRIDDDANTTCAVAVHRLGGAWAFASVTAARPARMTLPARPGAAVIRSSGPAGPAAILAPNGFPLDQVLPMVGVTPQVTPGDTLRLAGLPPAPYAVTIGMRQKTVLVRPGETTDLAFEK